MATPSARRLLTRHGFRYERSANHGEIWTDGKRNILVSRNAEAEHPGLKKDLRNALRERAEKDPLFRKDQEEVLAIRQDIEATVEMIDRVMRMKEAGPVKKRSCENCDAFQPVAGQEPGPDGSIKGECRARSVRILQTWFTPQGSGWQSGWPPVMSTQWCREWGDGTPIAPKLRSLSSQEVKAP